MTPRVVIDIVHQPDAPAVEFIRPDPLMVVPGPDATGLRIDLGIVMETGKSASIRITPQDATLLIRYLAEAFGIVLDELTEA